MAVPKHNATIYTFLRRPPGRGKMCAHAVSPLLALIGIAAVGGGMPLCAHASSRVPPVAVAQATHVRSEGGVSARDYVAEKTAKAEPPEEGTPPGGDMKPTAAAAVMTMPEMAQRIVNEYPRVQSLRAEVRAAQMEVDQVRAANGLIITTFSDAGGSNSNLSSGVHSDLGVRGRYPVQDWGKGEAEIGQAQAKLDAATARLNGEIYNAWLKLADAYIAVMRARSTVEVSANFVGMLKELRDQVEEIVSYDKGRAIDLRQVENRISQATLQLMERKVQEYDALIQLRELVNLPALQVEKIDGVGTVLPSTLQDSLARLDEHPSVIEASRGVDDAEQSVRLHQAQEKPRVDLQATVSSRNAYGHFNAFNNRDVRLVLEWDAFDGGSARSKTAAASERLRAANDRIQVVRRDLQTEVGRGFSRSRELKARSALWMQQIDMSVRLRADYLDQFRVGRRTVLDLLSATNDIFQARLNEATDRFDMLNAEYRLYIQLGLARSEWLSDATAGK